VISLSIAGLGIFSKKLLQLLNERLLTFPAPRTTKLWLSRGEVVGSSTIKAVPFKDTGSAEQYMVLSAPPKIDGLPEAE
jgi:hypothetical protein